MTKQDISKVYASGLVPSPVKSASRYVALAGFIGQIPAFREVRLSGPIRDGGGRVAIDTPPV